MDGVVGTQVRSQINSYSQVDGVVPVMHRVPISLSGPSLIYS
jgi:hypothetical protein